MEKTAFGRYQEKVLDGIPRYLNENDAATATDTVKRATNSAELLAAFEQIGSYIWSNRPDTLRWYYGLKNQMKHDLQAKAGE